MMRNGTRRNTVAAVLDAAPEGEGPLYSALVVLMFVALVVLLVSMA